ncbi:orotidine 5'-phosphate decarboxylase / HUMPS family protein [Rhodococcus sp. BP-332]|uniref:orotidine 5'-phosphate decarboxylase / HUMPS family protein n=1 Tax=Rhodococcus sp. BP-332 TaxID=2739447 RepID=UPI0021BE1DB3|nr:orotidine 5'-phosphate decarboxylase / HUMPS family protein [Rhodococcus sp. BP-332]
MITSSNTPLDFAVLDRPAPGPGHGQVLVQTEACGLCGSDVHAWRQDAGYYWVRPPVTMGHEAVGTVVAVGAGVDRRWVGRRVVPVSIDGRGDCAVCRRGLRQICEQKSVLGLSFDGAAAELFVVDEHRLVPVEHDLPVSVLVLTEPLSVACLAVTRLQRADEDAFRAVVSGPGPNGADDRAPAHPVRTRCPPVVPGGTVVVPALFAIKAEGLRAVSAIKAAHPDEEVFADLETADAGFLEADIAFTAGADIVTVLGSAGDATIKGAVEAGQKHGKKVVADLIGVADRIERAREVAELGVSFVETHAGLDEQAHPDYSIQTLLDDGKIAGVPFSIAGGVKGDTIIAVRDSGADVAVAGGAIYGAEDPAAAAEALRDALTT